jgi:hypothetical protein
VATGRSMAYFERFMVTYGKNPPIVTAGGFARSLG